ncbi:UNVERIFIED_CONTAM: hypothetical protein Sindi_3010600, partial [Sesamum indicum]
MITSGAAEAPFVGRLRGVLKRHFTTEVLERVGGRTSTDRVGENVTGRSLGKTAGSDLRSTCGRLGEAGRHAGAQTAYEQRLLPIGDCKTVRMGTSLMCGDAIRQ